MFSKPITLFKLLGFPIRLDLSWFIVAILITWSLAVGFFPTYYPSLESGTYLGMGIAGAIGLFLSILLHELGHAVAARYYGLSIRSITLFIFGGVAELEDEPQNATVEFVVAIAGPIVSLLLTLAGFGLTAIGQSLVWPEAVNGVLFYLSTLNATLVIFNIIPAFPLDGGRVLRAALWHVYDSLRKATRITSTIGAGFGFVFIGLGILSLLMGNIIGGIWTALIGLFLRNAANMSYQQLLMRQSLEGEPVSRFMSRRPITVSPSISVQTLTQDYIYQHYYKMFPVVEDDSLVGCVTVDQVKELPREDWPARTVGSIMTHCSIDNTISPNADAMDALSRMGRMNASRLMVTENNRLVGIIALKDLLKFFRMKVELEGDAGESQQAQQSTGTGRPRTLGQAAAER